MKIVIIPYPVMIAIKLGPLTKPDKRNTITSKKLEDDVMLANCTSLSFFQCRANLEQS